MPGALTGRLYVQRVQVVRYEADGWGIGEVVHDGSRLLYHDHPRPRPETAPKLPQGIPEIPVITESLPTGKRTLMFFKLFARAP